DEAILSITNSFELRIKSIEILNNAVVIKCEGLPDADFVFETSQNLSVWIPVITNRPQNGAIEYIDDSITNSNRKFYRIKMF
ncbi:MAG TPA: hypothetical protein PLW02_05900, partial [Verrucomicrobiota bacterium]|nr:hypothetical protein [Verrucomicrobiota bacterium]